VPGGKLLGTLLFGPAPSPKGQMVAMTDPYLKALQDQWQNIRALYMTYESKKPIILFDLQEQRIYAYPYKEFKAEMSEKDQALLEKNYKSASTLGSMVVFVRDNIKRKLVSYIMDVDTVPIDETRPRLH
jgi:hypothetical protein